MARLYASPSIENLELPCKRRRRRNFYSQLKKCTKANSKLNLTTRLTKYNAGSKINELLLLANTGCKLPSEWIEIYPNLQRELEIPWVEPDIQIELTQILDPIPFNSHEYNRSEEYQKFSELSISPLEMKELKNQYEEKVKNYSGQIISKR
jgi:hypothetical protein